MKKYNWLKMLNLKYVILLILITVSVGFFYAYPITFTEKMIDELNGSKQWTDIVNYILFYMFCRVIGCVLDYSSSIVSKIISNNLSVTLKRVFLEHYYSISSEYVYTEKFEKIYTLYNNDITTIANGICGPVLWFFSSVSLFVWSSITLVNIRWELAVIYIFAALMILITTTKAGNTVKKLQVDKRKTEEIKMYAAKLAIEQYMKLLIMRYDHDMVVQNVEAEKNYNYVDIKETKITSMKTLVNDMIYYLAGACVWLLGSIYILRGNMTTGEIVAFISFAGLIISPIVRFSSQWISIQKIHVSIRRIVDFISQPSGGWGECSDVAECDRGLVVCEVSFAYAEKQKLIENFSYKFMNGQSYCIYGENGCGKSTLLKLICRIYDTYTGQIRYGGQDIRNLSKDTWYNVIAYEDESPIIVLGTLYDNLTLGIKNASKGEVDYLCEKIGLFDSLGSKYSFETIIEKGSKQLSSGQKQMIGIIRNLLSHKKILILDETLSGIAYPIVCVIINLYKEYCDEYGSILLYVSHDEEHQMLANSRVKI